MDVFAGLSGFNAMLNGAKALAQMNNELVRLQASIDLQRQIFATQQDYQALAKTVDTLEAKIAGFEDWERQKQRYDPQLFEPGVTVYVLKPGEQGPQGGQHFCPNCYQNRKASILQATGHTSARRAIRICLECKAELAYGPQAPLPQGRATLSRGIR